jgi:sec-independent protein translocase protein TatA
LTAQRAPAYEKEKTGECGMFGIGMQEILLILVVGLLVFGANKLPEIGGGLGRAIRNFRRAASEPDEIDITPKEGVPRAGKKDNKEG